MYSQLVPAARASMHFQNSEYSEALTEYEKLLKADPRSGYLYAMVALCQLHQNKLDESEIYIHKGISEDPGYAELYFVAYCVKHKKKDLSTAEKFLLKALQLRPDDPDYLALLAEMQNNKKDWQKGFETATRGLDLRANHPGCAKQRTLSLEQLRKNKAKNQDPFSEIHKKECCSLLLNKLVTGRFLSFLTLLFSCIGKRLTRLVKGIRCA